VTHHRMTSLDNVQNNCARKKCTTRSVDDFSQSLHYLQLHQVITSGICLDKLAPENIDDT
jgi:hypothetical protein